MWRERFLGSAPIAKNSLQNIPLPFSEVSIILPGGDTAFDADDLEHPFLPSRGGPSRVGLTVLAYVGQDEHPVR
jgi:hypothetical protein